MSVKHIAVVIVAFLAAFYPSSGFSQTELSNEEFESLPPSITERASLLEDAATKFVDSLQEEDFDAVRGLLAESLQDDYPVDVIETTWQDVLNEAGELLERGDARYEWGVNSDFVAIELTFEQTQSDLILVFNGEQEVIGLDFPPFRTDTPQEIAEALVDSLGVNDFAAARENLHPVLKGELLAEDIEQKWTALQAIAGSYQDRLSTDVRDAAEFNIVIITLEFEELTDDMLVFVNDSRQIVGVDFPRD